MKNSIAAKLREAGYLERADALEICHTSFTVCQCSSCGTTKEFPNRCDRFYCPECQPRLARVRSDGVKWWLKSVSRPWHIVLTVRNTPDLTKGHVREFRKWWTNLRHKKFCRSWVGGLYSFEVTNIGNGWHLHLHAIVDAFYIDKMGLSRAWSEATNKAGLIVEAKECRDDSYLREATKYAAKGSEISKWKPALIVEFIEAFEGTKTFGVFGNLYRKRTEWKAWIDSLDQQHRTCDCGCTEFYFFSALKWAEKDLVPDGPARAIPPPDFQVEFNLL
jgi:hypothetical protein